MGDFDGITVDGKSVEECIETEKSKDIRKTLESTLSSQIKILPKIGKIKFPETKERNSKVYNYTATEIRRMNMNKPGVSATHKIMAIFYKHPKQWISFKDFVSLSEYTIPKGTISGILSRIKSMKSDLFMHRVLQRPLKGFEYSYMGDSTIGVDDIVKEYNSKILKRSLPKKPLVHKKEAFIVNPMKEVIDNNSNLSAQYLIDFIEGIKRMGLKVDININITS